MDNRQSMTGTCKPRTWQAAAWLAAWCCICASPLRAAEVAGSVKMVRQGLFKSGSAQVLPSIAVALLPAGGQRLPKSRRTVRHIEISGNRMHPPFMAIRRGSSVEVVNRDDVYHQLFSVSRGEPVSLRLNKAGSGGDDRSRIDFGQSGTTHLFCRIHKKSYARIDVVDTPYLKMVQPGEAFRFSGVAAGDWQLRVSAPAAETRLVAVKALTSPPPVEIELSAYGGDSRTSLVQGGADARQLYGD